MIIFLGQKLTGRLQEFSRGCPPSVVLVVSSILIPSCVFSGEKKKKKIEVVGLSFVLKNLSDCQSVDVRVIMLVSK